MGIQWCEPEVISVPWNHKGPLEEYDSHWEKGQQIVTKHIIYKRQPAPEWMLHEFCNG